MVLKGITKRWVVSSLSLMPAVLALILVVFGLLMREYYYDAVKRAVYVETTDLAKTFDKEKEEFTAKFTGRAREYVQDFSDREYMELSAFDADDNFIASSMGIEKRECKDSPDYDLARKSSDNYGMLIEKTVSGEDVVALTKCIYADSGEYLGSFRYIVSLSAVKRTILSYVVGISTVMAVCVLLALAFGFYFMKSIVNPLNAIGVTAKKIAQGDFKARIQKQYDDEIGELYESINYIASELGASEKIKNDFISSISHELRTPLTAIKGWAETIQLGGSIDSETNKKGLRIIINESERLSGIVEELLDFSRMQIGEMTLMIDKIDILAEVDEAVYIFKDCARNEGKELIYEAPKSVSPIFGDKNRLKQVFINVIDNALKYTPKGGIILVKVVEEDNIKVIVTDNGCGIPKEHLPRIKEKFYKANKTQRGSGIGLAVANEIMILHSGNLDISSQEGIGTVVTISIPKASV